MKYEKEIDQLLHDLFYDDWMRDDDYNQIISEILKEANTSKQELSGQLEIGLENGYSIDNQIKLLKASLNMIHE